jgi:hypothetical protein
MHGATMKIIVFSILSSNTLSPYLSIHLSNQIFTPMQTAGKIILFLILIFCFIDSKWKDKIFLTEL